jgi:hypothetical protein
MPWLNSRTVSESRKRFLEGFNDGAPLDALMAAHGIRKSAAYELLRRARETSPEEACQVKSRAPHRRPGAINDVVRARIVALKDANPDWGPKKLRVLYDEAHGSAPSTSTFANVLKHSGRVRPYTPPRKKHPPQQMSPANAPNDVWAVDHKGPMERINRIEPLNVVDVYSRFWIGCRPLIPKTTVATRAAFEEWFTEFGLPRIIRIDAGSLWVAADSLLGLTKLSSWWVALGVKIEIAPYCQLNGVVERLHGTMEREMHDDGVVDVRAHFERERHRYNHLRPHEGIAMKRPVSIYSSSSRAELAEREFKLGDCDESRVVQADGHVNFDGRCIHVSEGLAGRRVGLRQLNTTTWSIRYFEYELLVDVVTGKRSRGQQPNGHGASSPTSSVATCSTTSMVRGCAAAARH